MIPSTTLGPKARPGYSWEVGPASAFVVGIFLLAGGVWLTLFGASLGSAGPATAASFFLVGALSLITAVHLARQRRPISRREMLADLRAYEPSHLEGEAPNPDEFRKL